MRFMAQTQDSQIELVMEMGQVQATHIPKFNPFEVPPRPFIGIELRRIARQLFQVELFCRTIGQIRFDLFTAMNRRAVPNHQQLAARLPPQMLQKMDAVG